MRELDPKTYGHPVHEAVLTATELTDWFGSVWATETGITDNVRDPALVTLLTEPKNISNAIDGAKIKIAQHV